MPFVAIIALVLGSHKSPSGEMAHKPHSCRRRILPFLPQTIADLHAAKVESLCESSEAFHLRITDLY
jgi:hypothetical protein